MPSKYDTDCDWISGDQTVFVGQNKRGIEGPGVEKQALTWSTLLLVAKLPTVGQKRANEIRKILKINIYYVWKYFTRIVNPDMCRPVFYTLQYRNLCLAPNFFLFCFATEVPLLGRLICKCVSYGLGWSYISTSAHQQREVKVMKPQFSNRSSLCAPSISLSYVETAHAFTVDFASGLVTFKGLWNILHLLPRMPNAHSTNLRSQHNLEFESDVWLTVHRNSVWIRKTN